MTKPNTAEPQTEPWRTELQTAVADAIRQTLDLGYDPARIAAELDERLLLAGEPCPIECACGPRTVPWPREPITVTCETCGAKHAIAPLMDNYRSASAHGEKMFQAMRGKQDQLAEIRAVLDDWRDPDQVLEDIRAILDRPSEPVMSRVRKGLGQIADVLDTTPADVAAQLRAVTSATPETAQ
ncbi:hypothetical protein GCM10027258_62110 [Amycolatopsis stemonae]